MSIEQFNHNTETKESAEHLAEIHKEDIEAIEQLDQPDNQKAQLILILLGEQPAVDLFLDPNEDPTTIIKVLENAGLAIQQGEYTNPRGRKLPILFVGNIPEIAEKLAAISPKEGMRTKHEEYGKLMGFPQTAIDAFLQPERRYSKSIYDLDPNIVVGAMFLSQDHWQDELAVVLKKNELIRKYAPEVYNNLLKKSQDTK